MRWETVWSQSDAPALSFSAGISNCTRDTRLLRVSMASQSGLVPLIQHMNKECMHWFAMGANVGEDWILDYEETIDMTRWFLSQDRDCIPTVDLNPHVLRHLNQLSPYAICIRPCWLRMGMDSINRACLEQILSIVDVDVWIVDTDMSENDKRWLTSQGFKPWESLG